MSDRLPGPSDSIGSVRIDLNELLPSSSLQLLGGPHNNLRLHRYLTYQLQNQQPQAASGANTDLPRHQERQGTNARNQESHENQSGTWSAFLSQNPEVNLAVKFVLQYIPFFVIVLIKEGYEHGKDILAFLSLIGAFWHANKTLIEEVSQQSKRKLGSLVAVSFNLATCIAFVFFLSGDAALFRSALLWPPVSTAYSSIWGLLWSVIITDCILKLAIVLIKALFTALPAALIPFLNRGKYYVFMENFSQLYRSLATVQPWIFYLLSTSDTDSEVMFVISKLNGAILSVAYIVCKIYSVIPQVSRCRVAFSKILQRTNFGTSPDAQQLEAAGPLCPICHDEFKNPTCIQCRHIFCENCLSVWLSKEKTCPMCRSNVAEDPKWKDGSTTFFVQWF